MVQPIPPYDPSQRVQSTHSQEENRKLFEIEFETSVLSDYVAITGQNGSIQDQLSKIKNGMASGQSPELLSDSLNQLIFQINANTVPGKAKFPAFSFSSEGSQSISNFALSLQKLLNTAAETGNIRWQNEEKLFSDLSVVINKSGQMTPENAFQQLNSVIEQVNKTLSPQLQLPTIPFDQRR